MKRLVVCCDGTWQDLETGWPTNVVRVAQAVTPTGADGVPQIVYYDPGVGTEPGNKFTGGAFGDGLNLNIREAYRFLVLNYQPGDEIFLFGYSRGAYTVRSLGGLIRNSSIVRRRHVRRIADAFRLYRSKSVRPSDATARRFRRRFGVDEAATIEALCCWDTVGSLGVPNLVDWIPFEKFLNKRNRFHDVKVSRIIRHAIHALAIDEQRKVFEPTLMERRVDDGTPAAARETARFAGIHQMWFVGDHGGVGGGTEAKEPLARVTLDWMIRVLSALGCRLTLDVSRMPDARPANHLEPFAFDPKGRRAFRRPRTIKAGEDSLLHVTVPRRWCASRRDGWRHPYDPPSLRAFRDELDEFEC